MGQAFRKLFDTFFGNTEMRVVMLGLDAAGKTTILYKLHIGEVLSTVPTIGFNVEKVQYKNVVFTVWDVGGQEKLRPLWRHYFNNTDGLIYVVDSLDRERIGRAKAEFQVVYSERPSSKIRLCSTVSSWCLPTNRTCLSTALDVSSNYAFSDLLLMSCIKALTSHVLAEEFLALRFWTLEICKKGAMTPMEVCEGLGLFELKNRKWHIQGTCALRGDGLYEGLDWLSGTFKEMRAAGYSSVGTSSF
ncbi:hypothetical protein NC652_041069 [Populus alba x Populus x berolinensis]|uniref:ADP-ribosylation factor n=1 Tax=Populus alba x Populus x berolinensis TaxID=444605 RepID=A0AAD6L8D6_9ROSI|nr:hypothetical protein NC652_041069 [Populus alba x Populus x berolinensis]KAJ6952038.1 hypothetical protein NC653_041253 [Populus alba x Populus x berolinensis]